MEILAYILVLYMFLTPYFLFRAVKFGIKIAQNPEEASEEHTFTIPMPKRTPKMTAEEDRRMQILKNIDNYNGSSVGQVKVEVKHD